jgi:hypothetical protein
MARLRFVLIGCLAFLVGAAAPSPASAAVTVDQIVALSRAGVTDAVILALIDRDKTIFAIEPDQLVTLKQQGVSEPVILAMLKSGRDEGERAAQAAADLNSGFIMSSLPTAPEVVVVGHEPDVPNGGYSPRSLYGPPGDLVIPYAPYAPYAPYGAGIGRRRQHVPSAFLPYAPVARVPQFQPPFTAPFVSPFHEAPVARPIIQPPPPVNRIK